jgi:hypothetical protein
MKQIILLLVLFSNLARADVLGDEIAALKVILPADRQLSSNELRQLLELAHDEKIAKVAEIRLTRGLDGDGLFLATTETVRGRRVARHELTIWNSNWRRGLAQSNRLASTKTSGPFALHVAKVYTREWAMFTIGGKEMKLECGSDTDLADADKAFAAFYAKRVEYSTKQMEHRTTSSFNFYAPTSVSVRKNEVYIGFVHSDPLCGNHIHGKLKQDKLIIEDASTACI